ncbi:membrane transporter [Schizosaccharomyces japonicus yFS275]|uniref:Membrane transporter n=1 Tax=Schizosaccharomyces japonicus (strain yFS275 / FY16936) TaxID=402676 RepID=B6K494_SCHJY|nr:membrane transporter [Schizosaccharomyces japonicus yFS275]EEB08301.1 membrane transporter [Schizosaccharomyces japonicus yFS275]
MSDSSINERTPLFSNQAVNRAFRSRSNSLVSTPSQSLLRQPTSAGSQPPSPSQRDSPSSVANSSKDRYISPVYVLPLNFINAFAWALIDIPLLYLLRQQTCAQILHTSPRDLLPDDERCRLPSVSSRVSKFRALFSSLAASLGLLATAYYGTVSDNRGRRHVLIIASFFLLLGDVCLLVQSLVPMSPTAVLICALFKGAGGYVSTVLAAQNSFVADCSQNRYRAWYLGLNFATYHLGTAIGPIVGGSLIQFFGKMYSIFTISICLWSFYLLYTIFVLPETVDVRKNSENHTPSDSSLWSTIYEACLEPLKVVLPRKVCMEETCTVQQYDFSGDTVEAKRHWNVFLAANLIGLSVFASGAMALLPLYADALLHWSAIRISLLISSDALASALTLVAVFPLLSRLIGFILRKLHGSYGYYNYVQERSEEPSPVSGIKYLFAYMTRPGYKDLDTGKNETVDKRYSIVKRDIWSAQLGFILASISVLGLGISKSTAALFGFVVLQALSNMVIPAVQSVALNGVLHQYNGRILAAFAIFETLSFITRGPVYAFLYTYTVETSVPGTIFFVSCGIYLVCCVIVLFMRLYRPLEVPQ